MIIISDQCMIYHAHCITDTLSITLQWNVDYLDTFGHKFFPECWISKLVWVTSQLLQCKKQHCQAFLLCHKSIELSCAYLL